MMLFIDYGFTKISFWYCFMLDNFDFALAGLTMLIGVLLTLFIPQFIKEDITAPTLIKKTIGAIIMFFGISILLTS